MSRPPRANGAPLDPASSGPNDEGNWWTRSGLVARIAFAAIAVGVGLAVVFGVLFLAIAGLRHRSLEARHSQQVIATANQLQTLVIDLETGVRGFAITRDERYLRPWTRAQQLYPVSMANLLRLSRDNVVQHRRAEVIQREIDNYLSRYSRPLVGFMQRNPRLARTIVVNEIRLAAARTEAIRREFDRFLSTERRLGEARDDTASTTARNALIVGGIGLGAALLLILLGAVYVNRAVAQPVRSAAEAAARIAGGDFSGRLRTDGPGEVGRLERTFNSMAASLQRTLADLEERNQTLVESERTKRDRKSVV